MSSVNSAHGRQGWKAFFWIIGAGGVSALPFVLFMGFTVWIPPKFREIFEALGGALPAPTRFLLRVSEIAQSMQFAWVPVVVIAWIALWRYLLRGRVETFRRATWQACLISPLVLIGTYALGMLSQLLASVWGPLGALAMLMVPALWLAPVWCAVWGPTSVDRWASCLALPVLIFTGGCLWALFIPVFQMRF